MKRVYSVTIKLNLVVEFYNNLNFNPLRHSSLCLRPSKSAAAVLLFILKLLSSTSIISRAQLHRPASRSQTQRHTIDITFFNLCGKLSNLVEGRFHKDGVDSLRLEVRARAILRAPGASFFICDLARQVRLISNNDYREVVRVFRLIIVEQLLAPMRELIETFALREVKNKDTAIGAPIVRKAYRLELFLARGVPQL